MTTEDPIKDYLTLGVDRRDATAFHAAAVDGVPGNLVIVVSPDSGMAFEASRLAAAAALVGDHAPLDVHLAIAAGDRWTIAEVDDRIVRPAHLKAFDRTHVVVSDADQMAPAAYDHILKTVEEPTSGAQFWFAVASIDQLPVTLRGRSAATFTVRPAPVEERTALLESAGADPDHAHQVAALAGNDVRLAVAVAGNSDLLDDLRAFRTTPIATGAPTATADQLLAAIIRLASALPAAAGPGDAAAEPTAKKPTRRKSIKANSQGPQAGTTSKSSLRPKWDSLPVAARSDARRLLRRLLDRWAAETAAAVATVKTAEDLSRLDRALQSIGRARDELATNAPAATALPALLARTNL